jgi:hypothetical protein
MRSDRKRVFFIPWSRPVQLVSVLMELDPVKKKYNQWQKNCDEEGQCPRLRCDSCQRRDQFDRRPDESSGGIHGQAGLKRTCSARQRSRLSKSLPIDELLPSIFKTSSPKPSPSNPISIPWLMGLLSSQHVHQASLRLLNKSDPLTVRPTSSNQYAFDCLTETMLDLRPSLQSAGGLVRNATPPPRHNPREVLAQLPLCKPVHLSFLWRMEHDRPTRHFFLENPCEKNLTLSEQISRS